MGALTPQDLVDLNGTKPNFGLNTPTASDTAAIGTGSNSFLVYKNTDATNTRTVTIAVPGNTSYGQVNPPAVYTLATTSGEVWIPLRKAYDQGTSSPGNALITVTGTGFPTGVTVALVRHS